MFGPKEDFDQSLVGRILKYMSSHEMVLNLTSELIGIIVTLIVISMLGGWFVRRSAAKEFERKWASFRVHLASWVTDSEKQLEADFFYLGKDMIQIAEKPVAEINAEDLGAFRRKRMACQNRCSELLAFFERTHFALRSSDIAPATKYVEALRSSYLLQLESGFSCFEQFDVRLAMHLQGLTPLQDFIISNQGPTYKDVLLSSAKEADRIIMQSDRAAVRRLGRELAEVLTANRRRSIGS